MAAPTASTPTVSVSSTSSTSLPASVEAAARARAVEVNGGGARANAAAVRERLDAKTASIQSRIGAIEGEVVGLGTDARDAVFRNPAVSVAGALVGGLVVGLLVGKPTPKTRFDGAIAHLPRSMRSSAQAWAEAAEREVRRAGKRGEDAGDALRSFFTLNHPPVASEARVQEKQKKGIITGALLSILTTALTAAAKSAVDNVVSGRFRTTAEGDEPA